MYLIFLEAILSVRLFVWGSGAKGVSRRQQSSKCTSQTAIPGIVYQSLDHECTHRAPLLVAFKGQHYPAWHCSLSCTSRQIKISYRGVGMDSQHQHRHDEEKIAASHRRQRKRRSHPSHFSLTEILYVLIGLWYWVSPWLWSSCY